MIKYADEEFDLDYDDIMRDSLSLTSSIKKRSYDVKTKTFKSNGRKFVGHCGISNEALYNKLGGWKESWSLVEGIHITGHGTGKTHMWVRTGNCTIFDIARDQFGDTKEVHLIDLHDPRHKNYIETDIAKDDDGELMGDRTHEFYEDIMRIRNNRYNQKYDQIHNQIYDELKQKALDTLGVPVDQLEFSALNVVTDAIEPLTDEWMSEMGGNFKEIGGM